MALHLGTIPRSWSARPYVSEGEGEARLSPIAYLLSWRCQKIAKSEKRKTPALSSGSGSCLLSALLCICTIKNYKGNVPFAVQPQQKNVLPFFILFIISP
jgi:hypothetical protein